MCPMIRNFSDPDAVTYLPLRCFQVENSRGERRRGTKILRFCNAIPLVRDGLILRWVTTLMKSSNLDKLFFSLPVEKPAIRRFAASFYEFVAATASISIRKP
jgi:hypothetical protein